MQSSALPQVVFVKSISSQSDSRILCHYQSSDHVVVDLQHSIFLRGICNRDSHPPALLSIPQDPRSSLVMPLLGAVHPVPAVHAARECDIPGLPSPCTLSSSGSRIYPYRGAHQKFFLNLMRWISGSTVISLFPAFRNVSRSCKSASSSEVLEGT